MITCSTGGIDNLRNYATVDLLQIEKNLLLYRSALPSGFDIIAVVKANAYGHGDIQVARRLALCGVESFAVATLEEAVRLRQSGITGEILVLGYTSPELMPQAVEYGITQTLVDSFYAERLRSLPFHRDIIVQYAVDTGMNRIGLDGDAPSACLREIFRAAREFKLTGIYTHLSAADGVGRVERDFTLRQIQCFGRIAGACASLGIKAHCLNSAGGLYYSDLPPGISKTVRLGIALYGLKPSSGILIPRGMEPALSWYARVSAVKSVKRGEHIGYGLAYTADRQRLIATVTAGYADGYSRMASGRAYLLINGQRAPVVGRVCMDQLMVDVTDHFHVRAGDEAVLIGKSGGEILTADMLGEMIGTIGYEVLCGISPRVERIYREF